MSSGKHSSGFDLDQRLAPDTRLLASADGRLIFNATDRAKLTVQPTTRAMAEALTALADGLTGSRRHEFNDADGFDAIRFDYYCQRLRMRRMLEFGLRHDGRDLALVVPHRLDFAMRNDPAPCEDLRLSRFAYTRRTERGLSLDSPETACSVVLVAPVAAAALHALSVDAEPAQPGTAEQIAVIDLLWRCGFLESSDQIESEAEQTWEFHDRLFHAASRPGRVLRQTGGSFRFKDAFPSPPAVRDRYDGERIDLEVPARDVLSDSSDRLFDVLERRRSFRAVGEVPITLLQLSEFLNRVARTVCVLDMPLQELLVRNYPSGGAIHEIEFYLSVARCENLQPGFYHYHGADHALYRIARAESCASTIIRRAGEDWDKPHAPPQIVVTLASRFPRVSWKYDTVAYRLALMNAGVILQTALLVATDMHLACAPAGRGYPEAFAAATGLSTFEETSILEMGLGSRDPNATAEIELEMTRCGEAVIHSRDN